jgi:DNA-binding beta-propeller fold protein YncE
VLANHYGVDEGLLMELVKFADGVSGGPTGIAFDSQGNVYVCYHYSSDVVKYSPRGVKLMTITSSVSQPEGIAVQPSTGEIYVANDGDGGSITVYNPNGSYVGTLLNLVFE